MPRSVSSLVAADEAQFKAVDPQRLLQIDQVVGPFAFAERRFLAHHPSRSLVRPAEGVPFKSVSHACD